MKGENKTDMRKMYLNVLMLLVMINYGDVIHGQDISVLFNNTVVLDNSTIGWNSFAILQCTASTTGTTTISDQTTLTTSGTDQTETSMPTTTLALSSSSTDVTTTAIMTSVSPTVVSIILYSCPDGSFGHDCNISSDICTIVYPCLHGATCYSNPNLTVGYSCQCVSGFSGYHCENDDRICTENTCWHNGTCIELNNTISANNTTSFTCQCVYGYDGIQCELQTDMCANITCENYGVCVSSYLMWSCSCLDPSLYSGVYCQDKSSALVTKQALSKSFAIIAIVAMSCAVGFVMLMDVLKYVFKIDPVDRELHRLRVEKEKEEQKGFPKKKIKTTDKILAARFSMI